MKKGTNKMFSSIPDSQIAFCAFAKEYFTELKICTLCKKDTGTGYYVSHPKVEICLSCMKPKDGSELGSKNNVEELTKQLEEKVEEIQEKEAQIIKSKEEAKIIVLENLLRHALSKIEFLHGCLTEDGYKYAYPKMTLDFLEEANPFAPKLQGCYHSIRRSTCPACVEGDAYREKLAKAKALLDPVGQKLKAMPSIPTKFNVPEENVRDSKAWDLT